MSTHILVAYDGSDESATAIEHACALGEEMEVTITVVYAVQPDVYEAATGETPANFAEEYRREILRTVNEAEEQGLEHLTEAETIAEENGQEIVTELLYGPPVNKILEYSSDENVDMIVLGHRGDSDGAVTSLGSVAKAIMERASVPVTVTR